MGEAVMKDGWDKSGNFQQKVRMDGVGQGWRMVMERSAPTPMPVKKQKIDPAILQVDISPGEMKIYVQKRLVCESS